MTDKQVATKLQSILQQLQELQQEMKDGYAEDSLGMQGIVELTDKVHDNLFDFADSGDCLREFFPDEE